ncbi:ABC transporter permease subunit [Segeticoccus rhizosphaerae]|uniref:ABC transporter permease subunit n=1 Tax=Segeticoccus rhizosphaerae TaxID=1104777 RepID=UPI0010C02802|nr:ABC transporter permease subunit [Ornithinicoccus soli]
MSSPSDPRVAPPRGVIHDIGYRPYAGPRLGEGQVAFSLFLTGLRNCFGLGRSGKSKVLPLLLLVLMVLPALILVAVMVQLKMDQQLLPYARYAMVTQLLVSVFVAAQAPALISRDLRFRTITLYLARPLRRSTYVLVRLASLTAAVFILLVAPLLVLLLGGLLADLSVWGQVRGFLEATAAVLVLAAVLACLSALVSAVTTKRGIAVAAVIVVLLVSYTVVSAIQGISVDQGNDTLGQAVGLFSPFTLIDGLQHWVFNAPPSTPAPPEGTGIGVVFLIVTVLVLAGSVTAMLLRYRKAVSV